LIHFYKRNMDKLKSDIGVYISNSLDQYESGLVAEIARLKARIEGFKVWLSRIPQELEMEDEFDKETIQKLKHWLKNIPTEWENEKDPAILEGEEDSTGLQGEEGSLRLREEGSIRLKDEEVYVRLDREEGSVRLKADELSVKLQRGVSAGEHLLLGELKDLKYEAPDYGEAMCLEQTNIVDPLSLSNITEVNINNIINQQRHPDTTEENKFACTECGKLYSTRFTLQRHFAEQHEDCPRIRCTICSKTFKSESFRTHIKEMHSQSEPLACPQCGKTFKVKRYLRIHQNNMHKKTIADK